MPLKLLFCIVLSLSGILTGPALLGQSVYPSGNKTKIKQFLISAEFERLRSTHSQTILGGSLHVARQIRPSLSIGIGAEIFFTDSLYTHDLTSNIYRFRPIPIYGEVRFSPHISNHSEIVPYARLAVGMSAITYHLEHRAASGNIVATDKYQSGFFVSTGIGALVSMGPHFFSCVGIDWKGFHVSSNPYEINPHGITLQAGMGMLW